MQDGWKPRVEFAGAVYQVMCRGDHRENRSIVRGSETVFFDIGGSARLDGMAYVMRHIRKERIGLTRSETLSVFEMHQK